MPTFLGKTPKSQGKLFVFVSLIQSLESVQHFKQENAFCELWTCLQWTTSGIGLTRKKVLLCQFWPTIQVAKDVLCWMFSSQTLPGRDTPSCCAFELLRKLVPTKSQMIATEGVGTCFLLNCSFFTRKRETGCLDKQNELWELDYHPSCGSKVSVSSDIGSRGSWERISFNKTTHLIQGKNAFWVLERFLSSLGW